MRLCEFCSAEQQLAIVKRIMANTMQAIAAPPAPQPPAAQMPPLTKPHPKPAKSVRIRPVPLPSRVKALPIAKDKTTAVNRTPVPLQRKPNIKPQSYSVNKNP